MFILIQMTIVDNAEKGPTLADSFDIFSNNFSIGNIQSL